MGMLKTYQGAYEPMRSSTVSSDEASYTTTGFIPSNRPSAAKELPTTCNAVEILPYMEDATADIDGTFELWGWADNGPAEFLAEISATVGTALRTSTDAFCDKLVCTTSGHVNTVSVLDVGSTNNVSKIHFDTAGLKYVHILFTDISEGWNALIRYY
jgi:hypothetical protein